MKNEWNQYSFQIRIGDSKLSANLILPKLNGLRALTLFLLPLVEERKGTLPLVVHAARCWAEEGICSFFFDYSGCGDSSGIFTNTTPQMLKENIEETFLWVQSHFPQIPICIIGTRIAANFAYELAIHHSSDVSALIYWSPITGEIFLRQLFQRHMVNDMVAYGRAQGNRKHLEEEIFSRKTIDLDGYPLTPEMYFELRSLKPQKENPLHPIPTLLFHGGHDVHSANLFASYRVDKSELRYPPFWNTVGQVDLAPLIQVTKEWLLQKFPNRTCLASVPEFQHDPDFPIILTKSGKEIRLTIDRPQREPIGGILFLHGWSGDRTGPHRLFTRTARTLSEKGYLSLRLDFTGRGCSDGAADEASIVQMVKDAEKAYVYLQKLLPDGTPTTVLAICSGCKVAITLASNHPEIKQLILWSAESMGSIRNPLTGLYKTLNTLRTYVKKAIKPETWKKLLRGEVNNQLVTKALVQHEVRSAEEAKQEDITLKHFEIFSHPILFLYGGSDPDARGSTKAYSAFCKRHKIPYQLVTIPHAGHSYYSEKWTQEVLTHTLAFLDCKKNS